MRLNVTGSLHPFTTTSYLSAWRGRLTGAGGDGHGEILAVWSGLKLDHSVGADTDSALHLRVAVENELHGVFGAAIIYFDGERFLVARNISYFALRCLGLLGALLGLRLLLLSRTRVQGDA